MRVTRYDTRIACPTNDSGQLVVQPERHADKGDLAEVVGRYIYVNILLPHVATYRLPQHAPQVIAQDDCRCTCGMRQTWRGSQHAACSIAGGYRQLFLVSRTERQNCI
jgi:hypothetical protein